MHPFPRSLFILIFTDSFGRAYDQAPIFKLKPRNWKGTAHYVVRLFISPHLTWTLNGKAVDLPSVRDAEHGNEGKKPHGSAAHRFT